MTNADLTFRHAGFRSHAFARTSHATMARARDEPDAEPESAEESADVDSVSVDDDPARRLQQGLLAMYLMPGCLVGALP